MPGMISASTPANCTCPLCRNWSSGSGGVGGGGGGGGGGSSFGVSGGGGGGSRAGYAGIAGFDGEGSADYSLATGCVRGVRGFSSGQLQGFLAGWAGQVHELVREPWPLLRGVTGYEWHAGLNIAKCNIGREHAIPAEACGCGYWAYWSLDTTAWPAGGSLLRVAGVIEGTGRVLIGEKGFRCEKARIVALAPAFVITARDGSDQELADAIMGHVTDKLGLQYPGARAFATVGGMLASVSLGEITEVLETGR